MFTKIITNGIDRNCSTCNNLLAMRMLIKYNLELHLAFVDYQKAFDVVEY